MKPTLLVLAAGMGSRYGSLKQIDPVGPSGEVIIDYSIYDAIRAGFGKVVFIIRRDIEETFKSAFGDKFSEKIDVEYVFQELDNVPEGVSYSSERVKPWGTGHAVLVSAPAIHEPFAVINADDFYGAGAYKSMADYLSQLSNDANTHCMVGYRLGNTLSDHGYVSRGQCQVNEEDFLTGVTERTHIERKNGAIFFKNEEDQEVEIPEDTVVSMNMWGFSPAIFPFCEQYFRSFIEANNQHPKAEFYIPTVANNIIQENSGSVKVLTSNEKWFGVTYKEDKEVVVQKLKELIAAGVYPENLWN